MAGRCGCAGTCGCLLQAGEGITITGTGSSVDPWRVAVSGPATCDEVADCVGLHVTDGLTYNTTTRMLGVRFSAQSGNTITMGTDGGLYVPPAGAAGSVAILAGDTPEIDLQGSGTSGAALLAALTGIRNGEWTVYGNVHTNTVYGQSVKGFHAHRELATGAVDLWLQPTQTATDGAILSVSNNNPSTVADWSYVFGLDGQFWTIQPGTAPTTQRYRPVPWAMHSFMIDAADLGVPGYTTFTLPAGRFKIRPAVQATAYSSAWFAGVLGLSVNGGTITLRHYDNVDSPNKLEVAVMAVQMMAAVETRAREAPLQRMTESGIEFAPAVAICHTAGCYQAEQAVELLVPVPVDVSPVVCGLCEQPITDVVLAEGAGL